MSDSTALARMLASMDDSYQKTIGFPTYDILAAAALRAGETEDEATAIASKLDPDNLSGAELDGYIYPRTGQSRIAATFAEGDVTVTGTGTVSKGDLFESTGGVQFAATETVEISGSGSVHVQATTAGTVGNVGAQSVTMMPVTIPGISAVTNPKAFTGGYEAESDAAYYARYLLRIKTPPTSGNVYHYMEWALEVAGVGAVQVYPLARGDNTVDVVIINTAGLPADESLVADVQEHIDPGGLGLGRGEAPIGAYCTVSSATALPLTVACKLNTIATADRDTVIAAAKAALTAYLGSIAFVQDYVSVARIGDTLLDVAGVKDYESLTVNGSTSNISVAARQVATLGSFEVT